MNLNAKLVPADYQLVYTSKLIYYPILFDTKRSKSIHCVSLDEECGISDKLTASVQSKTDLNLIKKKSQSTDCFCRAIHYTGYNFANKNKFTSSNLKQFSNSNKNSRLIKTASKSAIPTQKLKRTHRMPSTSTNNEEHENFTNETSFHHSKAASSSFNNPSKITDTDAIQLLAEDVESKLEALLRTFIQEEKLRQEARHNSLMRRRSSSLNALNTNFMDSFNELTNAPYSNSPVFKSTHNNQQSIQSSKKLSNENNYPYRQFSYQKQEKSSLDSCPNQKQNSLLLASNRSNSPSRKSTQNLSSNLQFLNSNSVNSRIDLFNNKTDSSLSNSILTSNKINSKIKNNKQNLNIHKRSNSPSSSHQQLRQPTIAGNNLNQQQSLNLYNKKKIQQPNQQPNQQQQQSYQFSHRMYPNNLFINTNNNLSHFGRSKDDSHIRRVVVYNLAKDALNANKQKKPIVLEGAKSMNGTLNTTNLISTSKQKCNAETLTASAGTANNIANETKGMNINNSNRQQTGSAKIRTVKTRANSPSQEVGGVSIANENSNNSINKSSSSAKFSNITSNDSLTSNQTFNNNNKIGKPLIKTNDFLHENQTTTLIGHECAVLKDYNNNLDSVGSNVSSSVSSNVSSISVAGVGKFSNNASNNSERKLVSKVITKNLNLTSGESGNQNKTNSVSCKNNIQSAASNLYNANADQKNDAFTNLTVPIMDNNLVAKNTLSNNINFNKSADLLNLTSTSLNSLLSERDRILNNREQVNKQIANNNDKKIQTLLSSSDANNNYILSKKSSSIETISNNSCSSESSSTSTKSLINRVLPLSSTKRKVLINKFSPFSIVNEARQKWEENLIQNKSNGLLNNFHKLPIDFDSNSNLHNQNLELIFNECNKFDFMLDDQSLSIQNEQNNQILNNQNLNSSNPDCSILSNSHLDQFKHSPPLPSKTNANINNLSIHPSSMRPPLTLASALHSNGQAGLQSSNSYSQTNRQNNVKLFLSKGSVAERVMLFEKHPQLKQIEETEAAHRKDELSAQQLRLYSKLQIPYSSWKDKNKKEVVNLASSFEQNLKGKTSKLNSNLSSLNKIPRFYFPYGKPENNLQHLETINKKLIDLFKTFKDGCCTRKQSVDLCKASNLPIYWKEPLFQFVSQGNNQITYDIYMMFWKKLTSTYHDEPSKFIYILSKGKRNYLLPEDFIPMIQDVIDTHPGLLFLKFAFEFHSRYVHTVIARIYYTVNRSWSGKITAPELRKSNFLQIVKLLQEEDDINQITDYFSYEHFYVIYCKFWGLDKDHDLIIDKHGLSKHNDGAISSRMIDRIFSGAVTRGKSRSNRQMTYQEFVYFLISEEDKRNETSIEYWFRCLDIDGDGYLSLYELEYFYEEQVERMKFMGIEALPFSDCICQMLDMINPEKGTKISLSDLKKCSMTYIFLDTFFNLHKYLLHEQKDPFANKDDQTQSDWEKFAAEEYEILVAEESSQNQNISSEIDEPNIQKQKVAKNYVTSYIEDSENDKFNEYSPYQQVKYYYVYKNENKIKEPFRLHKNLNLKNLNENLNENRELDYSYDTNNEEDYDYIDTEDDYLY